MRIERAVVLVTGASSGIGAATSRLAAARGARVVLAARRQGGGGIVNVSSGTTLFTPVGTGGYAATKAALNVLSTVARAELAGDGIVVSTVYPFITATEFHRASRAGAGPARGAPPGMEPQSADFVAEKILELVGSGDEQAVLVPEALLRR
jgi:short-subunit dehydrogenase